MKPKRWCRPTFARTSGKVVINPNHCYSTVHVCINAEKLLTAVATILGLTVIISARVWDGSGRFKSPLVARDPRSRKFNFKSRTKYPTVTIYHSTYFTISIVLSRWRRSQDTRGAEADYLKFKRQTIMNRSLDSYISLTSRHCLLIGARGFTRHSSR